MYIIKTYNSRIYVLHMYIRMLLCFYIIMPLVLCNNKYKVFKITQIYVTGPAKINHLVA